MASDSLVSVVVPTYNRVYCLPDTIASVLAQTHGNVELIVVDDGSTDGTEALMRERYGSEPRLRYLRQDNRGVSAARNKGIDAARGDFIALLDSDDTWLPWKLEVQLACMRRFPSAVMAHTEMEAVDADGRVFDTRFLRAIYDAYERFPVSEMYEESCRVGDAMPSPPQALGDARVWFGDIFSHFLTGNLVHTSTLLIARAPDGSVERYDETMRTEETFDYHLRVAKRRGADLLARSRPRVDRRSGPRRRPPPRGGPAPRGEPASAALAAAPHGANGLPGALQATRLTAC